jgi:hypothetical protein
MILPPVYWFDFYNTKQACKQNASLQIYLFSDIFPKISSIATPMQLTSGMSPETIKDGRPDD